MKQSGGRAFSLVELLVVVAIVAILAALLAPAVGASSQRARFNRAVAAIAAELELARQAAVTGSTYAWVAFVDDSSGASSPRWRMVSARSLEGVPPTGSTVDLTGTDPVAAPLDRVKTLESVKLQDTLPNASSFQDLPDNGSISGAKSPKDSAVKLSAHLPGTGTGGSKSFPWAVEFNPLGEATVRTGTGAAPVDYVKLVVAPSASESGPNESENKQAALIWINGLSGGVEIYQP